MLRSEAAIAVHRREAGDSFDFNARHGRALQAQAAREALEALLKLFRSWRDSVPRRGWQMEWPVGGPQTGHCGRS